jgi:GT2 family glycosyltransferase
MTKSLQTNKRINVGIAVVVWNNESILPDCLDSIHRQTYKNTKTIVLDNNSSDNSAQIITDRYKWVRLIRSSTNLGFSKGNNMIVNKFIKDPEIKYIVLLNSDAALADNWIEELVNFAEHTKKVACMQGLTLDFFNHEIIDSTHIYINRNGQAIQGGYREKLENINIHSKKVFGVNAAACMITKDYLEKQPFRYLFDEDFFMYLEDVDVAARSVVSGWDNYSVPRAVAYHMGSASSGKNPGFSVFMVNRNILPTLFKNLPTLIIIKIIPRMINADIRELYRIARGKNYKIMGKYILGRAKGLIILPRYFKKTITVSKAREISNHELWELMKNGTRSH